MAKRTTSESIRLDMRRLRTFIFPDEHFWLPGGLGKVQAFDRYLLILLAHGSHAEVGYTASPCNFGGERLWFLCPECKRRVLMLYLCRRERWGMMMDAFACRRCADLCYPSQLEHSLRRAVRRAMNVRLKLGGSSNLSEPFPPKPKGMHWTTYERWRRRGLAAEARTLSGMSLELKHLKRRSGYG